ncbi:ATP-binding cassette domain-containing protein [Jiangella mangrovi]|uniref:ABC-type glutathione transport system ATPase component n=1 Tax=Jiangella mangrovi TaxID=1524084 RepID=A0A7W9GW66_9ACTN|nr:ATP-binding cassette domain-containing protein [Jiangella mangrovi]MBB5791175.1 ABC-type glutathione transport system ATPase component [Jiangella mangrovi]
MSEPLLRIEQVSHEFGARRALLPGRRTHLAVDDVSLTIAAGESVALVGESGSGKTTLGRVVAKLLTPTSGRVLVEGQDIGALRGRDQLAYRRTVQMIFQNTQHAFNPRRKIRDILSDPYEIHRLPTPGGRDAALGELLERVGLHPSMLDRYPHQFSGGQRQRIGIARALSLSPRLIVADEPVSALDVSVQAQVLNLFSRLRRELGLSLLFISHDLRAVYFLCERIAVLYQGRLVEVAPRERLLESPLHPYSRRLIAAVPGLGERDGAAADLAADLAEATGDAPDAAPDRGESTADGVAGAEPSPALATGCHYASRCPLHVRLGRPERCLTERPVLRAVAGGSAVACHFAESAEDTAGAPSPSGPGISVVSEEVG